ncbi:hypothetical protein [Lichenicoccus sp.]|uniref:hypothetical protein n=1 Tax=Lichenicoccus sp. TaxID=2781899 RepID=UPI003D0B71D2
MAAALIVVGIVIDLVMPTGILSGVSDRRAAFILAGSCGVTAALFKRFWQPSDFRQSGESQRREPFRNFLKNLRSRLAFCSSSWGWMAIPG